MKGSLYRPRHIGVEVDLVCFGREIDVLEFDLNIINIRDLVRKITADVDVIRRPPETVERLRVGQWRRQRGVGIDRDRVCDRIEAIDPNVEFSVQQRIAVIVE